MVYIFLVTFFLLFIALYIYVYKQKEKNYLEIEENALDIKKHVCLNKTNRFIGKKIDMLYYYNFYFYKDYLYMEREGIILFGELPILIKKVNFKSLIPIQSREFLLETYTIDDTNKITIFLRNLNVKSHTLELNFQNQEKDIENWLSK